VVLRWVRALVVGAVAFAAGVAAHLSAHGNVPAARSLVVLFLLVSAGTACFLGRPASTRRVVVLLMAGQTAVHAGLTALAGHAGDPVVRTATSVVPAPRTVERSGSLFDQYAASVPHGAESAQPVLPAWLQHLAADMTGPHAVMALAHLAGRGRRGPLARGRRARAVDAAHARRLVAHRSTGRARRARPVRCPCSHPRSSGAPSPYRPGRGGPAARPRTRDGRRSPRPARALLRLRTSPATPAPAARRRGTARHVLTQAHADTTHA